MPRVLIVANESESITKLKTDLAQRGLDCFIVPENNGPVAKIVGQHPAVVLLDADDAKFGSEAWELAQKMRQDMHVPLIALIARETKWLRPQQRYR